MRHAPREDENTEAVPTHRSSPGLANVLLALAALLSVPFFCFNEILGKPFLVLAGLIWIVFGVKAMVTGRVPSFSETVQRRPVANRICGVLILLFGLAATIGGLAGLFLGVQPAEKPADVQAQYQRGIDLF